MNPFTRFVPVFERQRKPNYRAIFFFVVFIAFVLWLFVMVANAEPLGSPISVITGQKTSLPAPAPKAPVIKESPAKLNSNGLSQAQEDVKAQIQSIAHDEGYSAPRFLSRLAFCESSLNPAATNSHSSALGLFQIIDSHGLGDECRTDVACSTKWTIKQLKAGHASWWECTDTIT